MENDTYLILYVHRESAVKVWEDRAFHSHDVRAFAAWEDFEQWKTSAEWGFVEGFKWDVRLHSVRPGYSYAAPSDRVHLYKISGEFASAKEQRENVFIVFTCEKKGD